MTPEHLKAFSLYADLEALFERAKSGRNYTLNALPEEEVANLLVELLAPVLVEAEDVIEKLTKGRSQAIRFQCAANKLQRVGNFASDVLSSLRVGE